MQITTIEGWTKVTVKDIKNRGGSTLLNYYNGSISSMLHTLYPEHKWDPTKFHRMPRRYWTLIKNQKAFMDSLATKYNIQVPDDWNQITSEIMIHEGGASLLRLCGGSITKVLKTVYPSHSWPSRRLPAKYWHVLR